MPGLLVPPTLSNLYLTTTDASAIYLSNINASATYLAKISASTIYATKEELGGAGLNPFFLSLP